MVRVVVIVEVRLYREGIAEVMARDGRIDVCATARFLSDALPLVHREQPDVALVDSRPAQLRATVRTLSLAAPGVCVVALAVPDDEAPLMACAEAGVSGYVTTDSSASVLADTLAGVVQGELRCPPRVAGMLLRRVGALAMDRPDGHAEPRLTSRELQVVRLIDEGMSNKEIARRLCIEMTTVKNHVHNILEKLQVQRRSDAAAWIHRQVVPEYELAALAGHGGHHST